MTKDELAIFERLAETQDATAKAMTAILERLASFTPNERTDDPALASLTNVLQQMAEGQQALARRQDRMQVPENKRPPEISTFNPRGDKDFPRPAMRCVVFPFACYPTDTSNMTREEIELYNVLIDGGDWTYDLVITDGTTKKFAFTVERGLGTDEPQRATISHPTMFNWQNKNSIPNGWIRTMLMGRKETAPKAAAVLTMVEERALIAAGQFNDGRKAEAGEALISVGA